MSKFMKAIAAIMLMVAVVCAAGCKKPSTEKRIIKFAFTSPSVNAVIKEGAKTIEASVPAGTSVIALTPVITVSDKATVYPASGTSRDFTNPVTYTVTAEDGSQAAYTVKVSVSAGSNTFHKVTVSANPIQGGTVTGGDYYQEGQSCTVSATANSGYTFVKWTDNGIQVSTNANYTFTVNGSRNLVANFTSNGGGGGNGGGGTQEGMYVGIVGFNDVLKTKTISLLNSSSQSSFTNFISSLTMDDNTALYYADETALDWLQCATLPSDLFNVSMLTFTDGLDNASLMLNSNYSSQEAYLNAIYSRILNDRVQGKAINAYSIGLRGNNVINEQDFQQKLGKLASNSNNVYLADNMDLVIQRFREIANQLYNEITTVNTNVKIPGGYDDNKTIRLTFDNVSSPDNSTRYIQAVFSRENGKGKLSNINYNGLSSTSGNNIVSNSTDGGSYWYGFSDLKLSNGQLVSDLNNMKLWIYESYGWRKEDEFSPSSYTNTSVTQKSAVAVLVLDCTTSLGATDFNKMKSAATEFITTLNSNSGGGGGGGGGGGSSTPPTGAINGKFSVSSSQKVYFSKGNLQYQGSTQKWQFAANQYNYIGNNNSNIAQNYSGWIDLFGWGTSGWNCGNIYYRPHCSISSSIEYGPPGNYSLTGSYANSDWGQYNAISNGGNVSRQWRTLTKDEWNYVFNMRTTTSGIRYAKAKVSNVNGVILLPDDWSTSFYSLSNTNNSNASFSSNTITATQWATLEQHDAVFLPAAGYRYGTSVNYVGSYGRYWSASSYSSGGAYSMDFSNSYLNASYSNGRDAGQSVRLVCPAN